MIPITRSKRIFIAEEKGQQTEIYVHLTVKIKLNGNDNDPNEIYLSKKKNHVL